jgi:hypothetical protein
MTDETREYEPGEPIAVAKFEGEFVTSMMAKLPAITMEMAEGYARGTHLRLMLEVRVKNVRYEEDRKGGLSRHHIFGLESVQLVSHFAPEEADDGVGGSASAKSVPTAEESEELGVAFGRTADHWDATPVAANDDEVGF